MAPEQQAGSQTHTGSYSSWQDQRTSQRAQEAKHRAIATTISAQTAVLCIKQLGHSKSGTNHPGTETVAEAGTDRDSTGARRKKYLPGIGSIQVF